MRHGHVPLPSPIEDDTRERLFRKQEVFNIDKEYHFQFRLASVTSDVYPEVNNGRHFVFCDLARYDIAFRIGLFRYVEKNKYAFVIGGSTMRYRKRLAPFRKATVRSKIVGFDGNSTTFSKRLRSSALISVYYWRNYEGFGLKAWNHGWLNGWDNETRPEPM